MSDLTNIKIEYSSEPPKDWLKKHDALADKFLLKLLYNRGITDSITIRKFLKPSVKNIPSPRKLPGALKASKEILDYISKGKRIFIHGDFDADGITATAILWEALFRELKADVLPYIPSRVDEGYGLSEKSIEAMLNKGAEVIITVDCGIRDELLIKKYLEKGIKFIVTDHHKYPEDFDSNQPYTIVHPNLPNKQFPFPTISGATVAFLLKELVLQLAGKSDGITEQSRGLDLAGISAVTDIMPLTGVNRDLVYLSFKQIQARDRIGLNVLLEKAGLNVTQLSSYHYGFVIGPRLNASGRIGNPLDAVKLLVTNSPTQASELADRLEKWNLERQDLTSELFEKALELHSNSSAKDVVFIKGENWAEGIIGLVASKMQEKFNRPTIVVSISENECRGSCRSINGVDITEALSVNKEWLTKFGGHTMAAGFSLQKKNLEDFEKGLTQYIIKKVQELDVRKRIKVDEVLKVKDVNLKIWNDINKLEPFGLGNPRPLFLLKDVVIVKKDLVGKERQFLKLQVKGNDAPLLLTTMFFTIDKNEIEKYGVGDVIDIVGYVDVNIWKNNITMQFLGKYIKKV